MTHSRTLACLPWPLALLLIMLAINTAGAQTDNLALNRPAYASSVEGDNVASRANDGEDSNEWRSHDPAGSYEWWRVDLQYSYTISSVIVRWHSEHFARSYQIQVSDNASNWATVFSTTTGYGGNETVNFDPVTRRHVRIFLTEPNQSESDYRIEEFEVYAADNNISCEAISSFNAQCNSIGTARLLVRLLNSTQFAGQTVEFQLDDTVYPVELVTNGTHTAGRLTVPGIGMGQHTASLVTPAGCFDPVIFNCRRNSPEDPVFEAIWAEVDALYGEPYAANQTPTRSALLGNYPNPFNPSTKISYVLAANGHVSLKVYNMLGQVVATLVNENQATGSHVVTFNASSLPSGIYLYDLTLNGQSIDRRKAMLVK